MIEIKQINTGVAELLAVKVPEYELAMVFENELFLNKLSQEAHFRLILPPGNWTPLGISDQLTEEQCAGLVERLWDYYKNYLAPKDGNVGNYKRLVCYTAKEAFASLMQANGVNEPRLILKAI